MTTMTKAECLWGSETAATTSKQSQRSKKKNKKPRKPLSAYNLFFRAERERILQAGGPRAFVEQSSTLPNKSKLSQSLVKMSNFQGIATVIAASWRSMDASKKEPYEVLAARDLQECNALRRQEVLDTAAGCGGSEGTSSVPNSCLEACCWDNAAPAETTPLRMLFRSAEERSLRNAAKTQDKAKESNHEKRLVPPQVPPSRHLDQLLPWTVPTSSSTTQKVVETAFHHPHDLSKILKKAGTTSPCLSATQKLLLEQEHREKMILLSQAAGREGTLLRHAECPPHLKLSSPGLDDMAAFELLAARRAGGPLAVEQGGASSLPGAAAAALAQQQQEEQEHLLRLISGSTMRDSMGHSLGKNFLVPSDHHPTQGQHDATGDRTRAAPGGRVGEFLRAARRGGAQHPCHPSFLKTTAEAQKHSEQDLSVLRMLMAAEQGGTSAVEAMLLSSPHTTGKEEQSSSWHHPAVHAALRDSTASSSSHWKKDHLHHQDMRTATAFALLEQQQRRQQQQRDLMLLSLLQQEHKST